MKLILEAIGIWILAAAIGWWQARKEGWYP